MDASTLLKSATALAGSPARNAGGVFTDLNGLNAIKQQGRIGDDEALRSVARQFESMFVNMMMKSMRSANKVFAEGGIFQSFESDMHQQMLDDQLGLTLTEGRGIGLADVLFRQMQQQFSRSGSDRFSPGQENQLVQNLRYTQASPLPVGENTASMPSMEAERPVASSTAMPVPAATPQPDKSLGIAETLFRTPVEFVQKLAPQMRAAAQSLRLDVRALLAQAALETGWGKQFPKNAQGDSSFNLFGIKAGKSWGGDSVYVPTLEYEGGVAKRYYQNFRSYESFADSAMDFARLLQNSPRYQSAVKATADPGHFWRELQNAGYATDPLYAEKLNRILQSDTLKNALQSVDSQ